MVYVFLGPDNGYMDGTKIVGVSCNGVNGSRLFSTISAQHFDWEL